MKKIVLYFAFFLIIIPSFAQFSQVQSGLIYHFTKYVEWPTNMRSGNFVIGVVGKTDITTFLKKLASSKMAGTQKIVVKEFKSINDVTKCHIIYLPKSQDKNFTTAVAKGISFNALLITEKNGLGKKGSCVNFIIDGGKPKFEVNKSAIQKAKLKINDKLVALGVVVG